MPSLYDLLGSVPDATQQELRHAYRETARRLHPDRNADPQAHEAMRRLNDAWAVLGNPAARERYDAEHGAQRCPTEGTAGPPRRHWVEDDRDVAVVGHPLTRLLRPSVVILAVLALIFVITAYAGRSQSPGRPATVSPATTAPAAASPPAGSPSSSAGGSASGVSSLVGECILPLMGYDAVVACNQSRARMVVTAVAHSADCPPGTTVYQLEGRSQLVCLAQSAS